jgi:hypothetical protein
VRRPSARPEKTGAGKAPHHCKTADDGQATYRN